MGKLTIKSIEADKLSDSSLNQGYLYKDLFLDVKNSYSYNNQLNRKEELKDIAGLYDIEAIKNSITNAFLTIPGQKILNPEFGIDLRRYIFEQVDVFTADEIQFDIEVKLPNQEPRIEVENVTVVANPDENEYKITLQINVPTLNVYGLSIKSTLNNDGYFIS